MSSYKITSFDDDAQGETIAIPAYAATPPPPTPTPSSGSTRALSVDSGRISGRYEIIRLVGVGGMGSVYQARDVELDEIVALKTLRSELVADADMLDRFKNEVKLARRVTHRNVARMFDIGEHDGERYLTMEFVDGESLAGLIAREKRLSLARALAIASSVVDGLAAAHAAGVIHRDLKPDNVMIAKDGRVLVTDFGIARAAHGNSDKTMGLVLGTPTYMAPEQVQGIKDIDGRADIYAFGAMLFELLTGEHAWTGETPIGIATARLLHPPPDPRLKRMDLPEPAARVVLRCMAVRREDRYASADLVAAELAALTAPQPAAAPTSSSAITSVIAAQAPLRPMTAVTPRAAPIEPATADKTVAVLPFRNAGAPSDEYLADGLTDDLIDALSMTRGLRVCSRGAVMKFRGASADAREIGGELGVQVVVEGSVRKSPGAVRINARLISVADGFQLWAKRFDRPDSEIFTINDEAAQAIAEALTGQSAAPSREAPTDPIAIDLYLRARSEYHQLTSDHVARAVELFEQALLRAPNDPMILSGYAIARARYNFFVGDGTEAATQAAERAVAAAPNLSEAHLALATVRFQAGDSSAAIREAKLAVTISPGLAEAHWLLGRILCEVAYVDEGKRRLELSRTLDPSLHLALRDLLRTHALLGEWEKFDAIFKELADIEQGAGPWFDKARIIIWRRDQEAAKRFLADDRVPRERAPFLISAVARVADPNSPPPFEDSSMQAFLASSKGPGRRQSFFNQLEAEFSAFVGDHTRATGALLRSVNAGLIDLLWIARCPLFEPLQRDPTYRAVLIRVEERARMIVEAFTSP